jgi:hypothetical protein
MPTIKSLGPTDLDYELAQLGDPLTDDALDMLDTVITARDAAADLLGYITRVQKTLEAGATPHQVREQYGADLDDLIDTLTASVAWVNN